MDAVRAWHLGPDSPGLCQREEDLSLQVALQAAVETRLCLDEPPTIRRALARLQQDGLDRFGAVVALQAVLSTTMVTGLSPDLSGGYAARIAAVARSAWARWTASSMAPTDASKARRSSGSASRSGRRAASGARASEARAASGGEPLGGVTPSHRAPALRVRIAIDWSAVLRQQGRLTEGRARIEAGLDEARAVGDPT